MHARTHPQDHTQGRVGPVPTRRRHRRRREREATAADPHLRQLRDARAELSRIRHEIGKGTYVKPADQTLDEYLDEYLVGALRGRRESTKASHKNAFRCPRERLGDRPLQSITKADIEALVEYMLNSGRKSSGKPGTGLGARSVRLTLGRLAAAFELAFLEGRVARNPVKLVTRPEYVPAERRTWSKEQVQTFLTWAASDRLHAAWRLSLYGLRRGEVLGLRWSDVDLDAGRLSVKQARVLVGYRVYVEAPKSRNSRRKLPMDDTLISALKELRKHQARSRLRAGAGYGAGLAELDWYDPADSYVVTDELGTPVHPEWYSDEFARILRNAQLPKIRGCPGSRGS